MDTKSIIKHKIISFYFNLTRKENIIECENLGKILDEILYYLKLKKNTMEPFYYLEFIKLLWIMIVETRDIENGKGERELTYMMLFVWYKHYPLLSIWMLKILFVGEVESQTEPIRETLETTKELKEFEGEVESTKETQLRRQTLKSKTKEFGLGNDKIIGCWKDIKHFCHYIRNKSNKNHPLIYNAIDIILNELYNVVFNNKFSNVAKLIPREKTKYNWLFCLIVKEWYRKMGSKPILNNKNKKKFRTIISNLNKKLDVVEIKQCSQQWSKIDPNNINTLGFILKKSLFIDTSSINKLECSNTLNNYLYSEKFFNNITRTKSEYKSRVSSEINLKNNRNGETLSIPSSSSEFSASAASSTPPRLQDSNLRTTSSKIRNIPIGYYVKRAFELINTGCVYGGKEVGLLNKLWTYNTSYYHSLTFLIPMVFIDKFTMDDSFFYSIGLACLLSEKSVIKKRILFYINGSPHWISFMECLDFFSVIVKIKSIIENITLFNEGFFIDDGINLLLDSMIHIKMTSETMEKMVLVFISSIDFNLNSFVFDSRVSRLKDSTSSTIRGRDGVSSTIHSCVQNVFIKRGVNIMDIPHIVYWNCSQKNIESIPCKVSDLRVSLLSGISSSLINYLFHIKLKIIRNLDPFEIIYFNLNNKKYKFIWNIFNKIVQ